jgi:hypothetical protein
MRRNRSLLAYIESLGVSLDELQEEVLRRYWREKQRDHRTNHKKR